MAQCISIAFCERMRHTNVSRVSLYCDACSFNYEQLQFSVFTEGRLPTCYLKTIGCKFIVVTGKSNFLSYLGFNRYRMLPKGKKNEQVVT